MKEEEQKETMHMYSYYTTCNQLYYMYMYSFLTIIISSRFISIVKVFISPAAYSYYM